MRRWFVAAAVSVAALVASPGLSVASEPPLPNRMAAIGDSITMANDVCCWYGDHPSNSWSTGGASWDSVSSHYERIRAMDQRITGYAYNDARSGARMSDGPRQAEQAVFQGAKYVTILLGANDLCTSSTSTMTSVTSFRDQFRRTLATLDAGLPGRARIFVASIPDVYHLWELYRTDLVAQSVWTSARICQSLLSLSNTDAQRQAVRNRELAFNAVLADECGLYARCRFDGNAVFNYRFSKSQVSKLDYFHPSLSGQAALASVTWQASWWG